MDKTYGRLWTLMDANSVLINRFKIQCNKFSGTISKDLGKVKKRLVKEMIYGIQASKDVKISNVSRALQEPIPLIKTEDRLCRNLNGEDLTSHINKEIMRLGHNKIDDTMVTYSGALKKEHINSKYSILIFNFRN